MMSFVTSAERVRELALALPETSTAPHFDRESLKVGGKIFATVGGRTVNLRLTPEQQDEMCAMVRAAEPIPNAWGKQGWTSLLHDATHEDDVDEWLRVAWRGRAVAKVRAANPDV